MKRLLSSIALTLLVLACADSQDGPPLATATPTRSVPTQGAQAPTLEHASPDEAAGESEAHVSAFQRTLVDYELTRAQKLRAFRDLPPDALAVPRSAEESEVKHLKTETRAGQHGAAQATRSGEVAASDSPDLAAAGESEHAPPDDAYYPNVTPVYVRPGFPVYYYDVYPYPRVPRRHHRARLHRKVPPQNGPDRRSSINGAARSGPINGAAQIHR